MALAQIDADPAVGVPVVRRLRFEWPEDLDPDWSPQQPELAAVANGVSLLMPHAEPLMVRAVRKVVDDLDGDLRDEALAWIGQETAHHGAHARFNRILLAKRPSLRWVDRWMARTCAWLERRGDRFGLAYAAGGELVAFMVARWVDRRSGSLFRGADRTATTLFLWHLAEEAEHKTVAFDVHQAKGGGRLVYAVGMTAAMLTLAWFTALATLTAMVANRRILHPGAHLRMLSWSLGFWFELGPAMAASVVTGHHPRDMADPSYLPVWLRCYDPVTRTMPEWSMDVAD